MLVIPTPESIYRGNYASLPAATLKPPIEGNRTVPIEIDWLLNGLSPQYTVHFNARQQQTLPISQIASLHIDNSQASSSMHVAFPDTQFEVIVGPNTVGFYPVVTNSLEFWAWIDKTPLAQDKTIIQVLNFLPPPILFSTQSGGSGVGTVREVDTVAPLQGGPITDIGTISLATPLALNFGGTGATAAGPALDNLSGASGTVTGTLTRASTGAWSVAAGLSSPITVANGGTGVTTLAPAGRTLLSNGTANVQVSSITSDNGVTLNVSTNQVIGTPTPGATSPGLTVNSNTAQPPTGLGGQVNITARDGSFGVISIDTFGAGAVAEFVTRTARGTAAAPTAMQLNDPLGSFNCLGRGATSYSAQAYFNAYAAENWTDTARGASIYLQTTAAGTTGLIASLILAGNSATFSGITLQAVNTVATLPAAAGRAGARSFVSDANAAAFNGVVAGGGTNFVPVFCDGTAWRIG